jgi:hypothetical protein
MILKENISFAQGSIGNKVMEKHGRNETKKNSGAIHQDAW